MSAILNHFVVTEKVSRGEQIMLKGKIDGIVQPHLVVVSFDGKETEANVYTDQQGYFATEFKAEVPKAGTYTVAVKVVEATEAGTEVTAEGKVRVTR